MDFSEHGIFGLGFKLDIYSIYLAGFYIAVDRSNKGKKSCEFILRQLTWCPSILFLCLRTIFFRLHVDFSVDEGKPTIYSIHALIINLARLDQSATGGWRGERAEG